MADVFTLLLQESRALLGNLFVPVCSLPCGRLARVALWSCYGWLDIFSPPAFCRVKKTEKTEKKKKLLALKVHTENRRCLSHLGKVVVALYPHNQGISNVTFHWHSGSGTVSD